MILVNFKNFKEAEGEKAIKLAKICKKISEETGVKIWPVVSALDVFRIKKETGTDVLVQNIDIIENGAKTGWISAVEAVEAGAEGSLLNHSEHKQKPGTIRKLLSKWPNNFTSVVCIHSVKQAEGWAKSIKVDLIAYEPSYLIGNRSKSVASEKPETIARLAKMFPGRLLVGAGIHSKEDVEISVKNGAIGVLVATDVVKAEDPERELRELAAGFKLQ